MLLLKSHRCMLAAWVVLAAAVLPALGQDAQADTAQALLNKGIQQYNELQFIEAKSSFLQADRSRGGLSADNVKLLDSYLAKVDLAIKRHDAGMAAYEQANDALKAGKLQEARQLFQETVSNEYLPAPVRKDAETQLALVDSRLGAAAQTEQPPVPTPPAPESVPPAPIPPAEQPTQPAELPVPPAEQPTPSVAPANPPAPLAPVADERIAAATPIERIAQAIVIERQRTLVRFEAAMREARDTVAVASRASDFAKAADSANFAKSILQSNRSYFPADEYQARLREVDSLIDSIAARRAEWERLEVDRKRIDAEAAAKRIEEEERLNRESRIAVLWERARVLQRETKYEQAIEVLDEIILLSPTDEVAISERELLQQFRMLHEQKLIRKDIQEQEVQVLTDVDRSRIPWYELLKYPRDWPAITQRREPFGVGDEAESEANRTVRRRLRQVLPRLSFDGIPFADVVDFLRQVSTTSIDVNWTVLQAAGIDRTAPVTVQLTDVPMEKALRVILANVGGAVELSFVVDEGVITISTKEDLTRNVYTRVYDIRDLIVRVPNFQGQRMDLGSQTGNRGTGGNGGSGSGSNTGLFGSGTGTGTTGTGTTGSGQAGQEATPSRTELITQILTLMRTTIDRDSWVENGGTVGSINELGGQIVVTQTADNHTALLGLLKQLREARALQVNIEARFIQVSSGFLTDIGLDADIFFNIGSTLTPAGTGVPNPLIPNDGPTVPWWEVGHGTISNRFTPIPVLQDSAGFSIASPTAVPGSIATGFGSSVMPAMQLAGSFLDDIQVDFFLRATKADTRSTTLTAPRLTLFNGQRAYVTVTQETAYVSDLEPVVSDNAIAFDTTVDVVASGTVLDVEATVSADRRYVTLTLRPQVSTIDGFNTYAVTVTDRDPVTGEPLTGEGFIQLPTITINTVETTVSIPDGGTLLIGGQKLAGELTKEMGVPILSDIPIINRMFTNRSLVRDERTLLILVKPTIIIHAETEEDTFGSEFSSR